MTTQEIQSSQLRTISEINGISILEEVRNALFCYPYSTMKTNLA